ncbi:restriction endonuclease subunit S [Cronobacter dublinensis]|uniref:restriction endonuclease subunit S n=1 Tax=Cronobacter dublinensis TaxID=413497 RepID=UPI00192A6660|nr:restriction endonuclease subunit S [Cronobacter dublinensis]
MKIKTVPLNEIFEIRYGHSLELNKMKIMREIDGGVPFVSRKMGDNGISAYVEILDDVTPAPPGELSCALSGNGVLSTFLQEKPFYTGYHVACLSPKTPLTKQQLLYYCMCIEQNRYRYSYGRQANRTLKNIKVPTPCSIPNYVNEVDVDLYAGKEKALINSSPATINGNSWRLIKLEDIFDIKKGQRLTKANMTQGETPYVGASDSNNGITRLIGQEALHQGGTITVSYNGSVAEAFYQPKAFWATDDVNVLYPKFKMSVSTAMFICAIIKLEKYRFNYGRKWNLERMKKSEIRLPTTSKGELDYQFMDNYINSLPFSSQL